MSETSDVDVSSMFVKFEATSLSAESLAKVKKEINETEEGKENGLQALRKKLTEISEAEEIQPCFDDDFLVRFLRVAWYDINYALDRVTRYYHHIKKNPDFFQDVYSAALKKSKEFRQISFGPYRLKDNSVLLVLRYGMFDPTVISFEESFILSVIVMSCILENPVTQMCGMTCLCDFSGFPAHAVLAHTPRRLKLQIEFSTNTVPVIGKANHLVNTSIIFQAVYKLAEPLLSKDMKSKLFVHPNGDDWKSLHSEIPPEILPQEFGGHVPPSDMIDPYEDTSSLEEIFHKYLSV